MSEENICRIAQTKNASASINILNFVYEKAAVTGQTYTLPAAYFLCLVTEGCGTLHTRPGEFPLKKGDLFFLFSTKPYLIENEGGLKYLYISFIGSRVTGLLERLHILPFQPVYPGYAALIPRWEADLALTTAENIDLVCEGLLLYTLSFFCRDAREEAGSEAASGILRLKQYVDLHYTDSTLNLKSVCERFGYNPKYASAAFFKLVKVHFSLYLEELRLSHAKTLLQNGVASIQEAAQASGYADALYFSKVFRQKYGMSPKRYREERQNRTET